MKKFGVKEAAGTCIGVMLFVILTEIQIPLGIVPKIALQIRAGVIASIAAILGPVVGCLVGLAGHAIGDAIFYSDISWSWVIGDAVFGTIVGLFSKWFLISEGRLDRRGMLVFNLVQVFANILSWLVVAPVLDVFLYAEPAEKVFEQGAFACLSNVVVIAVLGTLFTFAYSKNEACLSDTGM